jgi:uncharacterized protein YqeY
MNGIGIEIRKELKRGVRACVDERTKKNKAIIIRRLSSAFSTHDVASSREEYSDDAVLAEIISRETTENRT